MNGKDSIVAYKIGVSVNESYTWSVCKTTITKLAYMKVLVVKTSESLQGNRKMHLSLQAHDTLLTHETESGSVKIRGKSSLTERNVKFRDCQRGCSVITDHLRNINKVRFLSVK